jgi:hypothetical protein
MPPWLFYLRFSIQNKQGGGGNENKRPPPVADLEAVAGGDSPEPGCVGAAEGEGVHDAQPPRFHRGAAVPELVTVEDRRAHLRGDSVKARSSGSRYGVLSGVLRARGRARQG